MGIGQFMEGVKSSFLLTLVHYVICKTPSE